MRRRWHREEDGNALVLMPTGVLIMFVLAAIAIDSAVTFNAQRQLDDLASGVANDAATAIVDARYYEDGSVLVDAQGAQQRAAASLAARRDTDQLSAQCTTTIVDGGTAVRVRCSGTIRQIVSPLRWIGVDARAIAAEVEASPRQQ